MKKFLLIFVGIIFVVGGILLIYPKINVAENVNTKLPEIGGIQKPKDTLEAFGSQKELESFLKKFAKEQSRARKTESKMDANSVSLSESDSMDKAAAPTAEAESVTNVQHAGVDEGGIVKVHGKHLVILRRGKLFTVSIEDNSLQPTSSLNAFAPDINPSGTWYDEMLISGNTIAVIGYSYERGGTEIGVFNINNNGDLRYRSTYHLRSNDYYSSSNYASRLIGNKLIFYTPLYMGFNADDPTAEFPALRKWRKGVTEKDFKTISSPSRVYKPVNDISESSNTALHTVTVCNLDDKDFNCEATSVIGPAGRVFYVSPKSVYVWATEWSFDESYRTKNSTLYQMPLDGSAPTAIGVAGSPIDQFSFLESDDDYLNVLVRSEANGDGMWNAEVTQGETALLRIPRGRFTDGGENASKSFYTELPKVAGYQMQNRFVGNYLLYGSGGNYWDAKVKDRSTPLYAVRWQTGDVAKLNLEHDVERIEGLGKNALIVGTNGKNLYFSPIRLSGIPSVAENFVRKNAAQGEERSHGFFYKPSDSDSGFLGLPIFESGSGNRGYNSYNQGSASILFMRNDSLNLSEIGTLTSRSTKQANDNCKASCVDWYGNARPLFIKNRIFALLGYELVEGTMTDNGIKEKRRSNFSAAG